MPETEIEYTHESTCKHCGKTLMGGGTPTDFTLNAESKEKYTNIPADHECEFTEHYEYEEPIVETVEY